MTAKQQSIITYLQTISKGVINISQRHAQDIIDIAIAQNITLTSRAEMYQYNNAYKRYDHLRTIITNDDKINAAIIESVKHRPVEQFIKFELFNSQNEFVGNIYTVDACFFDKL